MKTNRSHPHLRVVQPEESQTVPPKYSLQSEGNRVRVVTPMPDPEVEKKAPRSRLKIYLSIMKPITWVPVVWSFWCGAVVGFRWELNDISHLLVGLLLSGPLLCGMSQAINDYFDREVDAVNEPTRSIPSQNITLMETYRVIGFLGFFGLLAAYYLGQTVFVLSLIGIALGHAYSAPPFRLKRFTWLCPLTSATSYVALPWLAAASLFGGIQGRTLVLTALYTLGAMGIMISNDFKSISGDYALKLPSVPVVYGTRIASRIVCVFIDCAQLGVITFLLIEGHWLAAGIIFLLMLPQLYLQKSFIQKPLALAIWYNARGQSFFVLGMLVASCLAM